MIAASPHAILARALRWCEEGEDVALVTLVGIEGSSSRSLGTQMAVTASGRSIGSFSGGCIEGAIVAEAGEALREGQGRQVRFGIGSPFIDVRLPCGGGIDLLFTPRPSPDVLRQACRDLNQRKAVRLFVGEAGIAAQGPGFALDLYPALRLLAAGQGEDFTAFVRLASAWGALLSAWTPSEADLALLGREGLCAGLLASASSLPPLASDPWTGCVLLFHDRDWEDVLLPAILSLPAFYRGAVGSRRTHAARLERLSRAGVPSERAASLRGHIGLIPATRDPATLAVSVLADVVGAYAAACQPPRSKAAEARSAGLSMSSSSSAPAGIATTS